MRAFYTDSFVLPLPAGHRFPMAKYRRVRERCVAEGVLAPDELSEPDAATWIELALVHQPSYLARVRGGALAPAEQREIGFPWSHEMVERSRRSVGATIAATRTACDERDRAGWGIAVNLAGGTHHAYAARGGGFCVFNDVAVAIRVLQQEGRVDRVAVIDCDVHQGNGTASIFSVDPSVLTFSMHGAKNYPFLRERSTIDVELPDRTGDDEFLSVLRSTLPRIFEGFRPDLVIYLAGADPFENDRLGRLGLTKAGLLKRDELVFEACLVRRVPVAVTMAGGYAANTEDTVDIHVGTVRAAAAFWKIGVAEESLSPPRAVRELPRLTPSA